MGREVPAWIEEVWAEWERAGRSGKWVVNWHRGEPVDIEERGMRFRPKPVARAGNTAPDCPKCGDPMAPRDGGTLFICKCGGKMTQAQARR